MSLAACTPVANLKFLCMELALYDCSIPTVACENKNDYQSTFIQLGDSREDFPGPGQVADTKLLGVSL